MDLSCWEQKIQRDAVAEQLDGDEFDEKDPVLMEHQSDSSMDMDSPSQELYKDGVLTLGCIGTELSHVLPHRLRSCVRRCENMLLHLL